MVKIVVLNDNRNKKAKFQSEHGFSLYIEIEGYKMLLDVGQTDIFLKNAEILGIDLSKIDIIVLSHGHYDHGDGLKYIENKAKLICHPKCNTYRISKRTGKYGGLELSKEQLEQKFDVIQTDRPYEIIQDVFFLGEIERIYDFEANTFPMKIEDGTDDKVLDDTGIAIKTEKGLIVISGCAHSGICNTVEFAKKATNENNILAVMGGFHLKEIDENTLKTIEYMQNNDINQVYLAHCTSDEVCQAFQENMPDKVAIMNVGEEYIFD